MKRFILLITNLLCIQTGTIITSPPNLEDFFLLNAQSIAQSEIFLQATVEGEGLCQSLLTTRIYRGSMYFTKEQQEEMNAYEQDVVRALELEQERQDQEYGEMPQYALNLERKEFHVGSSTFDLLTLPCQVSTSNHIYYVVHSIRVGTYFLFMKKIYSYYDNEMTLLVGYVDSSFLSQQLITYDVQEEFERSCITAFRDSQRRNDVAARFRRLHSTQLFRLCSLVYDSLYTDDEGVEFVQNEPSIPTTHNFWLQNRRVGIPSLRCAVSPASSRIVWSTFYIAPDFEEPSNIFVAELDLEDTQTLAVRTMIKSVQLIGEWIDNN